MRCLVDTGILLRLLDRADRHHDDIRKALRLIRRRGDSLSTTSQNLVEFWNVATRPVSARGGYGLSVREAASRLRVLERLFPLLPDTLAAYTLWRELVVSHAVLGAQVYDVRLVALMMAHGLGYVLTLNVADFTPFEGIIAEAPRDVLTA